jgi:hypothetical protein
MPSQSDVQALWAYSEISNGVAAAGYDGDPAIEQLRAKRNQGVPFDQLDQGERYCLAYWCFRVRPFLVAHMVPWRDFDLVQMSRKQIEAVYVPPNVWERRIFALFPDYMSTACRDPKDARNVTSDPALYRAPTEPLIFARHNGNLLLMDGYHRAASFWKCAAAGDSLSAYVPV